MLHDYWLTSAAHHPELLKVMCTKLCYVTLYIWHDSVGQALVVSHSWSTDLQLDTVLSCQ